MAMWTSLVDITFGFAQTHEPLTSVSGKPEDEPPTVPKLQQNLTPKTVPLWNTSSGWNSPSRLDLYLKNISHHGEVRLSITKDIDEDVNWIQYSVAANEDRF